MIPVINLSDTYYREDLYTKTIVCIGNEEDMIRELLSLICCESKTVEDHVWNEWSPWYKDKISFIENRIKSNAGDSLLYFADINYTGWDETSEYSCGGRYTKRYIYFDGLGRIIDIRNFIRKAERKYFDWREKLYIPYGHGHWNHRYGNKKRVWFNSYSFRDGPVPHTGHSHPHTKFARHPKGVKRILIQSTDPECSVSYRRGSIPSKSGLDLWDGRYFRYREHESWKNQKKRKQWM